MAKKQLCISVEGGGALGIGPLAFMCRLEQDLGKKLGDLTSAFAGTSTGSIIAAGLSEGYSAHDLYDLYKNKFKVDNTYATTLYDEMINHWKVVSNANDPIEPED